MTRRAYLPGLAPEPTPEPEQLALGIEPERDEALSQWFTPPALADALVEIAFAGAGYVSRVSMSILEPSAGSGTLVRALRRRSPKAVIHAVEIDRRWAPPLADAGASSIRIGDYLDHPAPLHRYDLIVANPPFTGGVEAAHVAKYLDEGDRVALLLPTRGLHGRDRYNAIWSRCMSGEWALRQEVHLIARPAFGETGGSDEYVLLDLRREAGPCDVRWM